MFSVKSKVIVVTGANGLLGKEIVASLRKEGAIVAATDIYFEELQEHDFLLDITNEVSVRENITKIKSKYEQIDGWVNNAYPRTKDWGNKLEDTSFDSWRTNVDMHLNGYFLCCQVILEQMKQQGFGSVVNMSSIYGLLGPDFTIYEGTNMTMPAAYSAIKGGINNLTRYLAAYFGPYNIRVNTVSPGGIIDSQPEIFLSNYCKKVPLRRMGKPHDIVSAIHFLLSDETAYITGHNLVVDGGWTII